MFNSKQLYHFYKELRFLLEHFSKRSLIKFKEKTFEDIALESYYELPNSYKSSDKFIDISNAINSGIISFKAWTMSLVGEFIKKDKFMKLNDITSVARMNEIVIFYSLLETKKQLGDINKSIEIQQNDNPFEDISISNIFKVNQEQKNELYELVKTGKINFYVYLYFLNKKFEVDTDKINDISFLHFIELMQIIRQNINKR